MDRRRPDRGAGALGPDRADITSTGWRWAAGPCGDVTGDAITTTKSFGPGSDEHGDTVTRQHWRWSVLAGMASYLDAGSIVALGASLAL